MRFIVKERGSPLPKRRGFPFVVLNRDNWDDFGYKTTFQVELTLARDETLKLGSAKILTHKQDGGPTPLPKRSFEQLDRDYCSIGQDLDYYEQLLKLGPNFYKPYLAGLRDVVFDDAIRARFEGTEGFLVSLMRFSGASQTLTDGPKLFRRMKPRRRRSGAGFQFTFKTSVSEESEPLMIPFDFRSRKGLPHRINALIGYNGTGKTQLLANLAMVASGYGFRNKKDILADSAGRFVGDPPPFGSVLVISYSAFDMFEIPGRNAAERAQIEEEGSVFGYVYCGLRKPGRQRQRTRSYVLKSHDENRDEFLKAIARIREQGREDEYLEALNPLLRDASFQRIGLTTSLFGSQESKLKKLFDSLSSGHKVVIKIASQLVAFIDGGKPTLVIIDEPEAHLHPPLLAAFLHSVRSCLEDFDGYAVVATHSPVVLQETPGCFVHIIRRFGDTSRVDAPTIETFGENIGVITKDIFNLDDGSTDWHETLRRLAVTHSLKDIEEMFDRRLSFAARAYVLGIQDEANDG